MSWIPAPLVAAEAGRTPVTVWLSAEHVALLETMTDALHGIDPASSGAEIVDQIVAHGLYLVEADLRAIGAIKSERAK